MSMTENTAPPPHHDQYLEPLGIVLLNSTEIGTISALGRISITAREMVDVDGQTIDYFVLLDIQTGGEYPTTQTAIIEYSEIDRFVFAFDSLRQANASVTKFKSFEAKFYSKNKIKISVFSDPRGRVVGCIGYENADVFFQSSTEFDRIRVLLLAAKSYIDAHRTATP